MIDQLTSQELGLAGTVVALVLKVVFDSRRNQTKADDIANNFRAMGDQIARLEANQSKALTASDQILKEHTMSLKDLHNQFALQAQSLKLINHSLERILEKLDRSA